MIEKKAKAIFIILALGILIISVTAGCAHTGIANDENAGNGDDTTTIYPSDTHSGDVSPVPTETYAEMVGRFFSLDSDSQETTASILSCFMEDPDGMMTEFHSLSAEKRHELFSALCENLDEDDALTFEKHIYMLYERYGGRSEKYGTIKFLRDVYAQSPVFISMPHIKLYDPLTRWESWIPLDQDDEMAVNAILENPSAQISLRDCTDTDTAEYFFPMDIRLLLPDMDAEGGSAEYEVFTNEQGAKVLISRDSEMA